MNALVPGKNITCGHRDVSSSSVRIGCIDADSSARHVDSDVTCACGARGNAESRSGRIEEKCLNRAAGHVDGVSSVMRKTENANSTGVCDIPVDIDRRRPASHYAGQQPTIPYRTAHVDGVAAITTGVNRFYSPTAACSSVGGAPSTGISKRTAACENCQSADRLGGRDRTVVGDRDGARGVRILEPQTKPIDKSTRRRDGRCEGGHAKDIVPVVWHVGRKCRVSRRGCAAEHEPWRENGASRLRAWRINGCAGE